MLLRIGPALVVLAFLAAPDGRAEVGLDRDRTRVVLQSDAGASDEDGDRFGAALAGGDLDADGYGELVVGAPDEDFGTATDNGAVFVFPGGPGGLGAGLFYFADSAERTGVPAAITDDDRFGAALVIGNFDLDVQRELVVGSPGRADGAGAITVLQGGGEGPIWIRGAWFDASHLGCGAATAGDRFGETLAVGDFDGDGFDDLAIGAPGEAPSADPAGGAVGVWFGKDAGAAGDLFRDGIAYLESDIGAQVVQAGDEFGGALAAISAGGPRDSLAIGAPGDPGGDATGLFARVFPEPGESRFGWLYTQSTLCCLEGTETAEPGDRFGHAMAAADLDGNGLDELVVGSPGEDGATGLVHLYSDVSLAGFALAQRYEPEDVLPTNGVLHDGGSFGSALARVDVDGDGREEVAIGAAAHELGPGGSRPGLVFVVPEPHGAATAAAAALALAGTRSRRSRRVRRYGAGRRNSTA